MTGSMPRFTETEKRILQLYFDGYRPKEISESLKCSVRTVYKAVYKYRRALREGVDPIDLKKAIFKNETNDSSSPSISPRMQFNATLPFVVTPVVPIATNELKEMISILKESLMQFRDLAECISKLNEEINLLRTAMMRVEREIRKLQFTKPSATDLSGIEKSSESSKLSELPSYLRNNPWLEILASLPNIPRS